MDRHGVHHFPGQILGSEHQGRQKRIRRQRRVRSRQSPGTESKPDANPGTKSEPVGTHTDPVGNPDSRAHTDSETVGTPGTESQPDSDAKSVDIYACDANSGAIGITESVGNAVDISDAHAERDPVGDIVGNSVGSTPAQEAGGDRYRRGCDCTSDRVPDCRRSRPPSASPPGSALGEVTYLVEGG